ncbi:CD225/dispanin family protein [Aureicoccus marinus]|uniref:CD225/dispanin family protein n=1 Tax=Aureicoccus marinus TaxID=754435 RepID=A0A2S7T441_9FLAO|nr:CD225/dispanin family protein [Aureicoccus marinus]PQJ14673.1 hypothetical protein BST99_01975 [Aureicoccus marinus]
METNNPAVRPPKPSNYLALAIITTILCCQVTGIVSIIYAARVNELYERGEYAEAERASKNAKIWGLVGIGLFVVIMVVYLAIFGFAIFAEASNGDFNF